MTRLDHWQPQKPLSTLASLYYCLQVLTEDRASRYSNKNIHVPPFFVFSLAETYVHVAELEMQVICK